MFFVRNLLRHKVRSLMTLLGAAIGISSYVSTTAITSNLEFETRQAIEGYNNDIAIQSRGAATPIHSRLKMEDIEGLRTILGDNVKPLVIGAFKEEWNPYAILLGAPPDVIARFGLIEGSYPTDGGSTVMIGTILARRLGLKPGDTLTLGDQSAQVVGIYSLGNRMFDGAIVADISEAQRRTGRVGQINLALGKVGNKASLKTIINEINTRFPHLNALSTGDFVGNIRLFRTVGTFTKASVFLWLLAGDLVLFLGCWQPKV